MLDAKHAACLAAQSGIDCNHAFRTGSRMVRRRRYRQFRWNEKNLLLRLRQGSRRTHVYAHVRASEICEPLVGQFMPQKTAQR